MAERHVPGDRAAQPDFEIVGMRPKNKEVDGARHRLILLQRHTLSSRERAEKACLDEAGPDAAQRSRGTIRNEL